MKNKKIFICLILLITSIVISCSWQIPENVKVKTKADYQFGVGHVEKNLTNELDIPKLLETQKVELPMGMKLFDYFPAGSDNTVQRYLARIPIMEYPLDIEQYLEKLDMVTKLDPINIDKVEFTVPEIKVDPIKFDIPIADVMEYVNMGVKGAGLVNKASVDLYPADILKTAGIVIGKVYYTDGILEVRGQDINGLVEGFGGKLPEVPGAEYRFSPTIKDGTEVTINFGPGEEGFNTNQVQKAIVKNNVATFSLKNVVIDTAKTKINFSTDPEIKFETKTPTGRAMPDLGGITVPDINWDDIKIPDNIEMPSVPSVDEIVKNPEIQDKIPGVTPGMTPDEIQNQLNQTTPVVIVEGYTADITNTSKIKKVVGLSILDVSSPTLEARAIEANIPGQTVNNMLPDESGVIRAQIGKGNIGIKIEGITADYNMNVNSVGGLTINNTTIIKDATHPNPSFSLDGIKIVKGESTVSGSASIKLKDTDIIFNPAPQLVITPVLESIATATVDIKAIDANINSMLKFQDEFPLPDEIKQFVHSIKLNNSGVRIKYTNTLPTGNNIKFKAESNFLNIHKTNENAPDGDPTKVVVIESGVENKVEELFTSGEINFQEMDKPAVDFNVEVILPREEGDPEGWVTAKNVAANKTYSIEFSLEPVIDWESVTIDANGIPSPSGKINTNLNLYDTISQAVKDIDPTLVSRINLPKLPIYVFCTKPQLDAFYKLNIEASAKLFFGKEEIQGDPNSIKQTANTPVSYILGSEKGPQQVAFVNSIPKINAEKGYVEQDFSKLDVNNKDVSAKLDLSESIGNILQTPGNLCLEYNVKVTNSDGGNQITVSKKDLQGKNSTIALEAYIDLGLDFILDGIMENGVETDKGMVLDIVELAGLQESLKGDLLQGNIKNIKDQNIDDILNVIKGISIDYSLNKFPISLPPNKDINIQVGLKNLAPKEIKLGAKGSIGIDNDDILNIFDSTKNPAQTLEISNIDVIVPKGEFSIKRDKTINVGLIVNMATDGTIEVMKDGKLTFGGAK